MRTTKCSITRVALASLVAMALAIPSAYADKPEKPPKDPPEEPPEEPLCEPAYYEVTVEVTDKDFWIEPEEWIPVLFPDDWPQGGPYPPVVGTITEDPPNDSMFIWGIRDSAGEYITAPARIDFRGFKSRFPIPNDWGTCFPTSELDPPPPEDELTQQFRVVQIWPEDDPGIDAVVQINWMHLNQSGGSQFYHILIDAVVEGDASKEWNPLDLEADETATLQLGQFVVEGGSGNTKKACTAWGTLEGEASMTVKRLGELPSLPPAP